MNKVTLGIFNLQALAKLNKGARHTTAFDREYLKKINPLMEYLNEHLLPGQIGHFAAVLSFVTALLATFAFVFATNKRENAIETQAWGKLGRFTFYVHTVAVWVVAVCLFYILANKMYEYNYAFSNVSDDQPFAYTFSAFWKEQPGSFLLWSMWHVIFGMLLLKKAGKWTFPVLAVFSAAEVFIASMLLGFHYGDAGSHLGVSPFELLRDLQDAPIFAQQDYLSKITGNGLNPLLQNYWNVIHPPTLFLGFASTLVPFSFAIAGLWLRDHKAWITAVMPWALFSGAILGTGILMGGAWAYEALSFGGYWAWDPVENASLVPWIIMVAGIHTAWVARNTGHSIRATYAFFLLSFVLILYSTYLTRSGILGDTSAHAFTEMGLGLQLILFIGSFLTFGFVWLAMRWSEIPKQEKEEQIASKEFWMFIGSIVLLFSAILITGATSLPVWNKIAQAFNPEYVGITLADPIEHHNRYQSLIGIFVGVLSGMSLFLRANERNWAAYKSKFGKHLAITALLAALLTFLNTLWLNVSAWQYYALLFAGCFGIVASLDYIIFYVKGNVKAIAAAVSHLGFGIMVLGILYTGLNKTYISSNPFAMQGLIEGMDEDGMGKNVLLMKEAPMPMKDGYVATYKRDTISRQTRTFTVEYSKIDSTGEPTGETFNLHPNVMYDKQFTKVVAANPSTKHYLTKDVFTLISSLPKAELEPEFAKKQEDSLQYTSYNMMVGDTVFTKKLFVVLEDITQSPSHPDYTPANGDLAFGMQFRVGKLDEPTGKTATTESVIYLRPNKGGFALTGSLPMYQFKARLREAAMEQMLRMEETLQYEHFSIKEGESFNFKEYKVEFVGADKDPKHPTYVKEEGDIAVAAILRITALDGSTTEARPLYLIRDNRPYNLKAMDAKMGLHTRFEGINPQSGTLEIAIAKADNTMQTIPVDLVDDAPRSDYIVMEAIVFPGINLVWLGSIMMMVGLAIGWLNKRGKN